MSKYVAFHSHLLLLQPNSKGMAKVWHPNFSEYGWGHAAMLLRYSS